jgi:glycosyltransferase involved in cell wall biosynthesis
MIKITVIILTKNAENVLADCLDSLAFCDEKIIIDDSSTDRTCDIAKMMGATVYACHKESFAEKRNLGLKKAKGKWVLYLDADERLSPELARNIQEIIEKKRDNNAAYRLQRKNFYLDNHEWPTIERLERLFKKKNLEEWYGDLHESARVNGDIGALTEGFINHYTHQDLTSMLNKTIHWSKIEAELRFNTNHPRMSVWRFIRVIITGYYDSYVKQKGYKAGTAGLIESIFQAFSMFITYARLWELQQKKYD